MRIPRVYINSVLEPDSDVTLDTQASHYLAKVLRMELDRPIIAFNGDGFEYPSTLVSNTKRSVSIRVDSKQVGDRESPLYTHLAIAVSKGDRMDWVFQKATELGISEITPLFTERTEVKLKGERLEKKEAHWRQVLISSCEQCQRNILPILNPSLSLNDFFEEPRTGLGLVLHHRSDRVLTSHAPQSRVTLLIGPEGGLSEAEINRAIEHHQYVPLTLGPRVLRTETAPLAALTALQLQWGDLA